MIKPSSQPPARSAVVSIIIPTYNEAAGITPLLAHLRRAGAGPETAEILVADGGSTDATVARARRAGVGRRSA